MEPAAAKEVAAELLPIIRVYKDGTVERLMGSSFVPASLEGSSETGDVSSKDITISLDPPISARLYLPHSTNQNKLLPILVYFHGGGFCVESAFSALTHNYLNILVSHATVVAVSIEYRLAPEHPLPAAYHDCWSGLRWVASQSQSNGGTPPEPWLTDHGDFGRVFIGGDSAGGNIAHNIAVRAGTESLPGDVKVLGAVASQPFFWGSEPVGGSEPRGEPVGEDMASRAWKLVNQPGVGIDHPTVNPMAPEAPSLARLGCSRLLVCVGGKDSARDRNLAYAEAVKGSGWAGEVEVFEVESGTHAFHLFRPESNNALLLIQRIAAFLSQR